MQDHRHLENAQALEAHIGRDLTDEEFSNVISYLEENPSFTYGPQYLAELFELVKPSKHLEVSFQPINSCYPNQGYRIKILDPRFGRIIYRSTQNPATGLPLKSPADCLEVAAMYVEPQKDPEPPTVLSRMERDEVISFLQTAVEQGLTDDSLVGLAEQYIWNSYQKKMPIGELAGICYEAEKKHGGAA